MAAVSATTFDQGVEGCHESLGVLGVQSGDGFIEDEQARSGAVPATRMARVRPHGPRTTADGLEQPSRSLIATTGRGVRTQPTEVGL